MCSRPTALRRLPSRWGALGSAFSKSCQPLRAMSSSPMAWRRRQRFWSFRHAMSNIIDQALNRITMYLLMLYYAAGLVAIAFGFGFFKLVPHDPTALAFSAVLIIAVCWISNRLFATLFQLPVHPDSIS